MGRLDKRRDRLVCPPEATPGQKRMTAVHFRTGEVPLGDLSLLLKHFRVLVSR
jgi:hypothetical protein